MKDFNCDLFELSFRFKPEDIDQDLFLKAVGIEDKSKAVDSEGEIYLTRVITLEFKFSAILAVC
jgi:hypothetical protein